jgi:DNA mismatch endonuclease, patch repair protein
VPDIVDPGKRSWMMARVRQAHTSPELRLRRLLHAAGLRYRLHSRSLPGSPDLVFPKHGAVVFVHGCFWHRHEGCRHATTPASHREYWLPKFAENRRRDERQVRELREAGWRVALVWTCGLEPRSVNRTAEELILWLRSDQPRLELPELH